MGGTGGKSLIDLDALVGPLDFALRPEAAQRRAIAARLGLLALRKLGFEGRLVPEGAKDWRLEAQLGATVVQPCSVTLDPVTTRIDEAVTRHYVADMPEPAAGAEVEMPEDDTREPRPDSLDLDLVMEEALALALPSWPRSPGVDPVDVTVTEPGKAPLAAEDLKPFAALGKLRRDAGNEGGGGA